MSNFDDFMIEEAVGKNQEIDSLRTERNALRSALGGILDSVDYISGACRLNEMVGAVLPKELIEKARAAMAKK